VPLHLSVDVIRRSRVPLEAHWMSDLVVLEFPSPAQSLGRQSVSALGVHRSSTAQYPAREGISVFGAHRN
jgi:hypothetical protein